MSQVEIQIQTLPHFDASFELPFYATSGAAGCDIKASFVDKKGKSVEPGERCLIPTGLSMAIPHGYEVQVRPRSGLSLKSTLMIVNSPGTIDSDYRGEICVIVGNFGKEPFFIEHGLRIAQLVVCPVWTATFKKVENLDNTERGAGGFGSTGTR